MRLRVSRRGRRVVAGVTVAALAAAAITAYAASGASASYRTATVALGNVTQVLDLTGTVSPSGRSDLQFGTAGTVSKVLAVGSVVHRGDVIASLDTTELGRSLVIAQASVAQALAQLSTDQAALNAPTTSTTVAPTRARGDAAESAVAAAQAACVGSTAHAPTAVRPGGSGPSATPSVAPSAGAPSASAPGAPTSSPAPVSSAPTATPSRSTNPAACAAALQKVNQAVRALNASTGAAGTGASGATSSRGAQPHVTQATISRDEATLAQARTRVIQAQQALTGAVISAPADGTVVQTDVTPGAAATAGTAAVTVIGAGVTTVSINATVAQVAKMAIGQSATVSSTLGAKVATGRVTWIGQLPSSSSTSTFPVVVTLSGNGKVLEAGAPVDVAVALGTADGVVTVPSSAVRDGSVSVLAGGAATTTRVTVGLVGPDRTQITSGLTPGETVVLADLSAALPTSTVNQGRFGGGLGGFGGFGGTRRAVGG